jgi:hypothetical protein
MTKILLKSWKTTTGGAIAAVCVLFVVLKLWNSYLTGEPIDFETVMTGLIGIASTINGIFGRDNNVSSEAVGIRQRKHL